MGSVILVLASLSKPRLCREKQKAFLGTTSVGQTSVRYCRPWASTCSDCPEPVERASELTTRIWFDSFPCLLLCSLWRDAYCKMDCEPAKLLLIGPGATFKKVWCWLEASLAKQILIGPRSLLCSGIPCNAACTTAASSTLLKSAKQNTCVWMEIVVYSCHRDLKCQQVNASEIKLANCENQFHAKGESNPLMNNSLVEDFAWSIAGQRHQSAHYTLADIKLQAR